MTRKELSFPVLAAILTQTVISAFTHLAARRAATEINPLALMNLRLVAAAACYALVLLAIRAPLLPPRSTWKWLLFFGLLSGPVNQGFFMYGVSQSSATHAAMLYALTPVGVYLVSVLRGREVGSFRKWLGMGIAFFGVLVLLWGRGLGDSLAPLMGDAFMSVAVVAWVFWTAESRPFAEVHGAIRTAGWSTMAGALWLLPMIPWSVAHVNTSAISVTAWECLAFLVLMTSLLSYMLWNYALARAEASRVAVFTNLQPILTSLAAAALLDEPITLFTGVSLALVVAGVRITQWQPATPSRP